MSIKKRKHGQTHLITAHASTQSYFIIELLNQAKQKKLKRIESFWKLKNKPAHIDPSFEVSSVKLAFRLRNYHTEMLRVPGCLKCVPHEVVKNIVEGNGKLEGYDLRQCAFEDRLRCANSNWLTNVCDHNKKIKTSRCGLTVSLK